MPFIQDTAHRAELVSSIRRQIALGADRQECKDLIFNSLRNKCRDVNMMTEAFFESESLIDELYNEHQRRCAIPDNPNPAPMPAKRN